MIRIIVRTSDGAQAANIGGDVDTTFRTFEFSLPELEKFLNEPNKKKWSYCFRQVIGVEIPENWVP